MRRFVGRYQGGRFFKRGGSQGSRAPGRQVGRSTQLYEDLKSGQKHSTLLVDDWLTLYKESEGQALSELLTFLLQSCGLSKNCITLEDLETREMDDLLEKIYGEAKESDEYPIMSRQKVFKSFYLNFQFFWVHLVSNANDQLYDGILLNFSINWLASLSFSKLRPIRHTSTAAVLAMGQSLIEVLVNDKHDLERVEMFIEAEMKKDDSNRLGRLKEQQAELQYRLSTLHDVMDTLYKEVLFHRCKDVMYEVRALACQALGFWADKYPSRYLEEATLKILGLLLYDKSGDVREHTLNCLTNLYKNHENAQCLDPFTEKYKARLVESCHDIEFRCCEYALKLCTILVGKQMLDEDEVNKLSYLMWADNAEIRHAASEFVIMAKFGNQLPQVTSDSAGYELEKGKDIEMEKALTAIVNFFTDFSDDHMFRVELLVDSFWKKTIAVRNWAAMCELLCRGSKTNTTELELGQRLTIVHMLIQSLKTAEKNEEKKSNQKPSLIFSTVLIQYLPDLLTIYRHDTEVMKELSKIPGMLDLNALASKDMKGSFSQILTAMTDIFLQATDYDILTKIGQAFGHLSRTPHTLQKEAQGEFTKIVADSTKMFNEQLNLHTLDEDNVLEIALGRVASILYVQDILDELEQTDIFPNTTKFVDDMLGIISNYASGAIPGSDLVRHSITCLYLTQLWYLNRVTKKPDLIEGYIIKRDAIVESLSICVAMMGEVKDLAFQMLCETLVIVSGQPASNSPLHYDVQPVLVSTIEDYMYQVDIRAQELMTIAPVNAFYKQGAKVDAVKEDATQEAAVTCLLVGRLISNCPSITVTQLASSYFAFYGSSTLKTIANTVRAILTNFKNKDAQQSGPFKERNLFYSILLDSMIKAFGTGERNEIMKLKELAKKLSGNLGNSAMRPKMAERFKAFILEAINFAFSEVHNFPFFEPMTQFLKQFLSPPQYKDIYERITRDVRRIKERLDDEEQLYPLLLFEYHLGKVSGSDVSMPKVPPGWNKKAGRGGGDKTAVAKKPLPPSQNMINASDIKKAREGFRPAKKTIAKKSSAPESPAPTKHEVPTKHETTHTKREPIVKPEPVPNPPPIPPPVEENTLHQEEQKEDPHIKNEPNLGQAPEFSPKREKTTSQSESEERDDVTEQEDTLCVTTEARVNGNKRKRPQTTTGKKVRRSKRKR